MSTDAKTKTPTKTPTLKYAALSRSSFASDPSDPPALPGGRGDGRDAVRAGVDLGGGQNGAKNHTNRQKHPVEANTQQVLAQDHHQQQQSRSSRRRGRRRGAHGRDETASDTHDKSGHDKPGRERKPANGTGRAEQLPYHFDSSKPDDLRRQCASSVVAFRRKDGSETSEKIFNDRLAALLTPSARPDASEGLDSLDTVLAKLSLSSPSATTKATIGTTGTTGTTGAPRKDTMSTADDKQATTLQSITATIKDVTSTSASIRTAVSDIAKVFLPAPPSSPLQQSSSPPPPTLEYLEQSGKPATLLPSPQPLLLVVDLNGTLICRSYKSAFRPRPGLTTFFNYIFSHPSSFQLMVWTSARPENTHLIIQKLFTPAAQAQLVAVWSRDRLGFTREEYYSHTQAYKKLETVWTDDSVQKRHPQHQAGGRWSQKNTVLVDDSILKASTQPHNLVNLPELTPDALRAETSSPDKSVLVKVVAYLESAREWDDVSAFMRRTPFRIDDFDPVDLSEGPSV